MRKGNPHNLSNFFANNSGTSSNNTSTNNERNNTGANAGRAPHRQPTSPPPESQNYSFIDEFVEGTGAGRPNRNAQQSDSDDNNDSAPVQHVLSNNSNPFLSRNYTRTAAGEVRNDNGIVRRTVPPASDLNQNDLQQWREDDGTHNHSDAEDNAGPFNDFPLPKFSAPQHHYNNSAPTSTSNRRGIGFNTSNSNNNSGSYENHLGHSASGTGAPYQWRPYTSTKNNFFFGDDDNGQNEDDTDWHQRQLREKRAREQKESEKRRDQQKESTMQKIKRRASSFFFGAKVDDAATNSVANMLKKKTGNAEVTEEERTANFERAASLVRRSSQYTSSGRWFNDPEARDDDDDDAEGEQEEAADPMASSVNSKGTGSAFKRKMSGAWHSFRQTAGLEKPEERNGEFKRVRRNSDNSMGEAEAENTDRTEEQLALLEKRAEVARKGGDPFYVDDVPVFQSPGGTPLNSASNSRRNSTGIEDRENYTTPSRVASIYGAPQLSGVTVEGPAKHKSYLVRSKSSMNRISSNMADINNNSRMEASASNRMKRLTSSLNPRTSVYNMNSTARQSMFGRSKSFAAVQGTGNKVAVDLEQDMDVDALIEEVNMQENELANMFNGEGEVKPDYRKSVAGEEFMPIMWTTRQFQHNMARAVVSKDIDRFTQLLMLYSVLKKQQQFTAENPPPKPLRVVLINDEEPVVCKNIDEKYREQEAHTYHCDSILDQVLDPDTGYTLMHLCVLTKKHSIIQECLRFGSQTHEVRDLQGDTPLTLAMKRFPDAVPVLFSLGQQIDLNRPCGPWSQNSPDGDANSASGAAQTQNLLFCCVDADEKTPSWPGRLTFIKFLVEKYGVRASQEDFLGFTPVMWAMQHAPFLGKPEKVEEIIRYLKKVARLEKKEDAMALYDVRDSVDVPQDEIAPDTMIDPKAPKPGVVPVPEKKDDASKPPVIVAPHTDPSKDKGVVKPKYPPSVIALTKVISVDRTSELRKGEITRMALFTTRADEARMRIQGPYLRLFFILLLLVLHIIEYCLVATNAYSPAFQLEVWCKAAGLLGCNWNGIPFFVGTIRVACIAIGAIAGCVIVYYFLGRTVGAKWLRLPAFGAQSEEEQHYYAALFGPYMAKFYDVKKRSRMFMVPVGIIFGLYCGALVYNTILRNHWPQQAPWAVLDPSIGNIHPTISVYIVLAIILGIDWYVFLFVCDIMYQQGALSIHLPHYSFGNFANSIDSHLRTVLLGPVPFLKDPKRREISESSSDSDSDNEEVEHMSKFEKAKQKEIQRQLKQLKSMRRMPIIDLETFRLYAFWVFLLAGWLIIAVIFIIVGTVKKHNYDTFYYVDIKITVNTTKACFCVLFASICIMLLCLIPLQEWTWPTFQKNPFLALPGVTGSTHHVWFLMLLLFAVALTDIQNMIEHIKMIWAVGGGGPKAGSIICLLPAFFGFVFFIVFLLCTSLRWVQKPSKPAVVDPEAKQRGTLSELWWCCAYGKHMFSVPLPNAIGLLHHTLPDLKEWEVLTESKCGAYENGDAPDVTASRVYNDNTSASSGAPPRIRSVQLRHTLKRRRTLAVLQILDMLSKRHLIIPFRELAENGRNWVLDDDTDEELEEETEYWRQIARKQNKELRENITREAPKNAAADNDKRKKKYINPFMKSKDKDKKDDEAVQGAAERTARTDDNVSRESNRSENKSSGSNKTSRHHESLLTRRKKDDRPLGEQDIDFNTLYGIRVVVVRRRNYTRLKQIQYQAELLAFVGDTSKSRRRVLKFRKKEERYMRALSKS